MATPTWLIPAGTGQGILFAQPSPLMHSPTGMTTGTAYIQACDDRQGDAFGTEQSVVTCASGEAYGVFLWNGYGVLYRDTGGALRWVLSSDPNDWSGATDTATGFSAIALFGCARNTMGAVMGIAGEWKKVTRTIDGKNYEVYSVVQMYCLYSFDKGTTWHRAATSPFATVQAGHEPECVTLLADGNAFVAAGTMPHGKIIRSITLNCGATWTDYVL